MHQFNGSLCSEKVLISAVTQYLGAFPHSKVMVVTPSTRALLGGSVDHSRVSVLRVETLTQLLAVSHYATNENIGSRHVLMLFYQMSPVLLAHKVRLRENSMNVSLLIN